MNIVIIYWVKYNECEQDELVFYDFTLFSFTVYFRAEYSLETGMTYSQMTNKGALDWVRVFCWNIRGNNSLKLVYIQFA